VWFNVVKKNSVVSHSDCTQIGLERAAGDVSGLNSLRGQVALVMSACNGIGEAIARALGTYDGCLA
jgi:hypothetical protein